MSTFHTFGVGCFHFGRNYSFDQNFETKKYQEELKGFLDEYENISDLRIEDIHFSRGAGLAAEPASRGSIQSTTLVPWPTSWQFSFNIFIPKKVQKELYHGLKVIDASERFSVRIVYENFFPVCFISSLDIILKDPSTAVVIVRKYLEEKHPDSQLISFQFLGPSPFHADFTMKKIDSEEKEIEFDIVKRRGYDDIIIGVPTNFFDEDENEEMAINLTYNDIARELGLYYFSIVNQNDFSIKVQSLQERIESLSKNISKFNLITKAGQYHNSKQLCIDILDMKLESIRCQRHLYNQLSYLENQGGEILFYEHLETNITRIGDNDLKENFEIAKEIENYCGKAFDARLAIFSAVIGGAIGAILTLTLG